MAGRRGIARPGAAILGAGLLILVTACAAAPPADSPDSVGGVPLYVVDGRWPSAPPRDAWRPTALLVLPTGALVVAETAQNRIYRLDDRGGEPLRLPRPDRGPVEWTALALAPGLSFLALDGPGMRVHQYDYQGNYLGVALDVGKFAEERELGPVDPGGLAVDRSGLAVITDRAGDRLLVFGRSWEYLGSWGESGSRAGSWRRPSAIAVGERAPFLVADEGNGRVVLVDEFGVAMAEAAFEGVRGVAVLGERRFAVAWGDRVEILDGALRSLASVTLPVDASCASAAFATAALAGTVSEVLAAEGCTGRILRIRRPSR